MAEEEEEEEVWRRRRRRSFTTYINALQMAMVDDS